MGTIRAFVAVELPEPVKSLIGQIERRLQAGAWARAVKWVQPAQMHITLKFLGDVDTARLLSVEDALRGAAGRHAPFEMRLAGLGTFPGGPRLRVVWMGLDEGEAQLVALTADVESALNTLGFKPERHEAHPHVTLGRVRDWAGATERRALGDALRSLAVPEFPRAPVDHVNLMQSHLSPQGASYQVIAAVSLRG